MKYVVTFVILIFILGSCGKKSDPQYQGSINSFVKNSDNKDPKEIVIDEFIGQSIPICLYELAHQENSNKIEIVTFYFIMFILFRIFDITKPYPASYYDKNIKNGLGVIMDDVVAGLYVVAIMVLFMVGKSTFF